jgi:hypothetical protein
VLTIDDTKYFFNLEHVLIATFSPNGDWWVLNLPEGFNCYYYSATGESLCIDVNEVETIAYYSSEEETIETKVAEMSAYYYDTI